MKKHFTPSVFRILALCFFAATGAPAFSQTTYNQTTITTAAHATAIAQAQDGSGDIYTIENTGHTTSGGEIVRYAHGTSRSVIYSGAAIAGNDDVGNADDYAFGIAIATDNTIYFTTYNDINYTGQHYGYVYQMTYAGNHTWNAPAVFITGTSAVGYFENLCMDSGNNLYVLQYDANANSGAGSYEVAKYNSAGTAYTDLYDQLETNVPPGTYSAITGLACDPTGKYIYVADWFEDDNNSYGGFVEKLTGNGSAPYSSYIASQVSTGKYTTALACDAPGNLYATVGAYSNGAMSYSVFEYPLAGGSLPLPLIALEADAAKNFFPFGLAVQSSGNVLALNGYDGANQGDYVLFTKNTATTPTTTSLSSSNNPSFSASPGNSVTFTATVTSGGLPVTSGTVTFTSNGSAIGSQVSVNGSGQATVSNATFSTPGNYNIVATYIGTSTYISSNSSLTQQVVLHPTTISSLTTSTTLTNSSTINYTATFAASVTGLSAGDFSLVQSGVTGSAIGTVTGSGTNWTIPVTPGTGTGTLQLTMNSTSGVSPSVSNATSGSPFKGTTVTIDQTAPAVSSISAITPVNANPVNATSVTYTVTFSEAVTGVSNAAFVVTGPVSTTGITVSQVSSSVYTVTVNGISGDGTLRLDLNSSGTGIADVAGNAISGGFTSGDTYTIDNTPPMLTSLLYTSGNANSAYAKEGDVVTLAFGTNEALQTPSVTIAGYPVAATNTGGNNYTASYTMTSGDTEGRVPFSLVITDIAGNSGTYNDVAAGDLVTFDMTPPATTISAPSLSSVSGNGTSSVSYTITYADANFNTSSLTGSGITLNTTGTANGTMAVAGSGTSYTVTISNISGAGTLGITIAGGYASDLAGNTDPGAAPSATFNVLSANSDLQSINPQYRPMSPQFRPHVFDYTLNVANYVKTIWVAPVTADPNATLKINGTTLTSGSQSAPVMLDEGTTTTVTILVTAQDNATTQTYTVHVKRAQSSNALLSSIGPNPGPLSPIFKPGVNTYTLQVPNSKASMTVSPVSADPNATISVNGTAVISGGVSNPVALPEGQATNINVVVKAQDGTINTYTIAVTRAPSSNADLTAMGPKYGPLSPAFQTGIITYSINLLNSKSTFTVTPVTHDANATITVNGAALASGSTSDPVALTAGTTTTITVVVTAQDGTTTKTYTIGVNRAPGSSDSYRDISVTKPAETVTLAEDGIKVHQGISPNGDGVDDVLRIDNIAQYPDNHLKIMNRNGELVFEAKGYDNISGIFDGRSNKNGKMQLAGTYFYQLEYKANGTAKIKTGFIVLKY